MLEAREVSLLRGRRQVLADLSLGVGEGEVVAVCGPNGAGKSSLLAVLAGEIRPSSGRALVDGADLATRSAADLARIRAVLEQAPALAASFTVSELVRLGISRVSTAETDENSLVADVLAATSLTQFAAQPADRLSGGELARAHLARVLAQLRAGRASGGGRFLLLDEPTAALDLAHQIGVLHLARAEARAGTGVLVVLHDLNLAASFADRIVMMSRGVVVADGAPAAVLREDLLTRIYETPLTVESTADTLRVFHVSHRSAGAG